MIAPAKFERLVVPLDGSRLAELAVPWARMIAERTHAEVDLVTSLRHATVPADGGLNHDSGESHQWASDELDNYGVRASTNVVAGEPATAIESIAQEHDAGLIVIATHGRSGVARKLIGSVTDRVLHVSSVPVLVVRVSEDRSALEQKPPDTVILPLDGSEASQSAVPAAASLAKLFGAKVMVLHAVHEKTDGQSGEKFLSSGPSIRQQMADTCKELDELGVKSDASISYLDPKSAIMTACQAAPDSLVVMASRGTTGVAKSRRGSVADHVIHHAPSPVVVVPPRGFLGPVLD